MEGFGSDGSGDLQCIGKLEVVSHKPVGFLCGTLPVPTDKAFHASDSALVPSSQTVSAPRYRLLPMETDLNTPPLLSNFPDKGFPISALHPRTSGGLSFVENFGPYKCLNCNGMVTNDKCKWIAVMKSDCLVLVPCREFPDSFLAKMLKRDDNNLCIDKKRKLTLN